MANITCCEDRLILWSKARETKKVNYKTSLRENLLSAYKLVIDSSIMSCCAVKAFCSFQTRHEFWIGHGSYNPAARELIVGHPDVRPTPSAAWGLFSLHCDRCELNGQSNRMYCCLEGEKMKLERAGGGGGGQKEEREKGRFSHANAY